MDYLCTCIQVKERHNKNISIIILTQTHNPSIWESETNADKRHIQDSPVNSEILHYFLYLPVNFAIS